MAPAVEKLDPFNEASDALLDTTIMVRIEGFGW